MEEIIKIVKKYYSFGKVKSISKITHGLSNDNYLIETSKGKFVVKKYKIFYTFKRIKFQIELQRFLFDKKFTVPDFAYNNKKKIITRANKTYYTVTKYVSNIEHDYKPNKERIINCIKKQIEFHKLTKNFSLGKNTGRNNLFEAKNDLTQFYKYNNHDKCNSVIDFVNEKDKKDEYDLWILSKKDLVLSLIGEILEGIEKIKKETTKEYTIIHYDYSPTNISYNVGSNDVGLILDFEFSHKDIIQLDVVKSARFFAYDDGNIDWNTFFYYLKQYAKLSGIKFDAKEVYVMLLFLVLRRVMYAWTYHYHYKDKTIFDLSKKDMKLIENIVSNKQRIFDELKSFK